VSVTDQARSEARPPDLDGAAVILNNLCKKFPGRNGGAGVVAIDNTSLRVQRGSTLGIVGESGSGKSTLARCILGLIAADSGQATVLGINTVNASARALRPLRRKAQIVFQEPY
jgi:peptide/nickel transport system ATP-binding protein